MCISRWAVLLLTSFCVWSTGRAAASEVEVRNWTDGGAALTDGSSTWVFPTGAVSVVTVSAGHADSYVSGGLVVGSDLVAGHDYTFQLSGTNGTYAGAVLDRGQSDGTYWFMAGFVFVFGSGLLALASRWVFRIIGGSAESWQ